MLLNVKIPDSNIAEKVIWLLQHFKNDGVEIERLDSDSIDVESSIKQAVNELNMVKDGVLEAKPVEELLNAL